MTLSVAIRHDFGCFALDVAFEAPPGVTALFGRSGAGKTSTVKAVAGILRPDAGRISIDGQRLLDTESGFNLPVHRRRVGYVFQDARLFPHLSVRRNLAFGRLFTRANASTADFARVVALLGLGDLLRRRPATLSGGETQRVAIGRALLCNPRILLMDEPLASLDEARKAEILPYLERLRDELELPILYVSHAIPEVVRLATTIVALDRGRVARQGSVAEILSDPDSFPLMGRQEAGSILEARVLSHDPGDGLTELETGGGRLIVPHVNADPGTDLRVRVRARDIMLALAAPKDISALNVLAGVVQQVGRQEGPVVDVAIRCGGGDLLARITRRSLRRLALEPGKPCHAILKTVAVSRRDVGAYEVRDD